MTQIDLGNIRINWRGAYNSAGNYVRHDAVSHQGSSFIAKRTVSAVTPVQGDDWDLMAAGTDQLTQEGDLLTHNGAIPARLARGGNAQVLQMVGNQPAWRDQSLDPSRRVWKLAKVNGMGGWHTRVYLMADGTIKACGYGGNYSNGDSNGSHIYTPKRVATDNPDVRFVDVFSGGMQHYALTADGEVWSWGFNNYGQLGHGNTVNLAVAKRIEYFVQNNIQIAKVIPGRPNYYDHACAYFLTTDGRVYACGINSNGNLGNGTSANQYTPIRCGALTNIIDVATSGLPHTTYAVQDDGSLWVWGYNGYGQLGLGDATNRETPILHPAFNNVIKALPSCGYNTAGSGPTGSGLVLLSDGTLWSAGFNGNGELGLGDTTQRTSFTQIALPSVTFTDIFVGDGRYASGGGITDQGEVYLWGYNGYGQLGTGNSTNQSSPQKPAGSFQGSVTKAAFGGGCSYEGCILQAGNDLWGAGYSGNANLGINSFAATNNTFQRVLGQSGVIEDWDCYGQGTASWGIGVLYDDGRVDACGDNNSYGETGTQVGNLHDVATLTNVIF
jgi:alpha-tubulin suppressor-like RCC1 family protein